MVGTQRLSAYLASKHALVGLTKAGALDYAAGGVRINAVCPGIIDTPMVQQLVGVREAADKASILTRQPIGRPGTPEEIAEPVAWLCSDVASLKTGLPWPWTEVSPRNWFIGTIAKSGHLSG